MEIALTDLRRTLSQVPETSERRRLELVKMIRELEQEIADRRA
jgi:hypothetical protein